MSRQRVRLLIVCVVMGAILNITVAWGCAIWSRPDATKAVALPQSVADELWQRLAPTSWNQVIPLFCDPAMKPEGSFQQSVGVVLDVAHLTCERSQTRPGVNEVFETVVIMGSWTVIEYRMGWPLLSFRANASRNSDRDSLTVNGAWQFPTNYAWMGLRAGQILPYIPIWPSLIINTFFFAAIAWLLTRGPAELRRRIRLLRNCCQACGYAIGTSPVCTECGVPVTRGLRPVAAPLTKSPGGAGG